MTNRTPTRAEVEALADFVENSIGGFISRKLLLHISIALRAYAATLDAPQAAPEKQMTEDQIKYMVDRFLG